MNGNKKILVFLTLVVFQAEVCAQNVPMQLMKDFPTWVNEKFNTGHPDAKMLGLGLFTHTRPLMEQYSAAKMQFAGTENSKFYIQEKDTDTKVFLLEPDKGQYWSIDNSMWSPNGNYIAVKQIDDHKVPEIKISSSDTNEEHFRKYSRAGEEIPVHSFYIVNTVTGEKVSVQQNKALPYLHLIDWNIDSKKLYFLMSDRLMKKVVLASVEVSTGKSTTVLTETSETYLIGLDLLQGYSERLKDTHQFILFEEHKQFSWMSERSGYNQIYLYDELGNNIRPLTNLIENGIVSSINEVDKKNGWIYFLAHVDQKNPYKKQLFRTSLKTPRIEKITDTPGIMDVFFRKTKDSIWVLRSSLPQTLQLDCYSLEGKYLETSWEKDPIVVSQHPLNFEYATSMSTKGSQELQSLILKPENFDANKLYPVVEYIYGAPFDNVVPHDLLNNWLWDMNKLAQTGFIVVFTDGRGTSGRGKKFNDFSYGQFGQIELEDHINTLKQLGNKRPYMDLNRIGIFGHSWGGHFALRALLEAPDFYKAGHINAAALDPKDFRLAIEPFMGCLPQNCSEKYEKSAISTKLNRLKAPLMIVHGTFDDDVPIEDSYKLVRLLDQMNYKNYEFNIYEGDTHIVMRNRQWLPQMIGFFAKNLKH